jgi:flagellar biosynthesis chaperone FliJ
MENITIQIDPGIAKKFESSSPQQQEQIQKLVNYWLKKAIETNHLQTIMDKMSDEAIKNGLTPEILESLLDENQ